MVHREDGDVISTADALREAKLRRGMPISRKPIFTKADEQKWFHELRGQIDEFVERKLPRFCKSCGVPVLSPGQEDGEWDRPQRWIVHLSMCKSCADDKYGMTMIAKRGSIFCSYCQEVTEVDTSSDSNIRFANRCPSCESMLSEMASEVLDASASVAASMAFLVKIRKDRLEVVGKEVASQRQIVALQRLGVVAPPTRKACRSLIRYIHSGNGTIGDTRSERIGIVRGYQKEWIGKIVTLRSGSSGEIVYLHAMSTRDVEIWKEAHGKQSYLHPFNAVVRVGPGQQVRRCFLSLLTVQE